MSPGEVARLLTEHPAVREAAVIERRGYPDDRRLVAYVVPAQQHRAYDSPAVHWQQHWDRIYAQAGPGMDPAFNTVGWCSNYSGEPLSAGEMREQVDETVAQVLALEPRRILEIGCGSGLLLLRLAPHCTSYVGTDFSQGTLDRVRQQLAVSRQDVSHVELLHRSAIDFEGIADGSFDIVIINSVVQYFPSSEYLAQVLAHATQALVPGGAVFVGDVRSLQLLEAFHLSVHLYRSPALLSTTDLRRRVARQVHLEQELVLDPAFFLMLPQRLPAIQAVRIMPKGGRFQNELTHFRYQVLLHTAPVASTFEVVPWLDWDQEGLTPSALRALLMEQAPRRLGLARVPNARLQRTLQARELLQWRLGPQTVGELRSAMEGQPPTGAMDPEAFRQLCSGLPYSVHLSWARHGKDGRFDVLFHRHDVANPGAAARLDALLAPAFPVEVAGLGPWDNKTNPPPGRLPSRELLPVLRAYLAGRLPEHLAPGAIVVLDRLPLTTNGTLDQRALPAPMLRDVAPAVAYQPPRTYTEEQMVGLWEDVLGVRPIGVHDSFFEWGGSDLQAVQLVSRVGANFDVEMPLRTVFELPRPALMASWVEQAWTAL